MYQYIISLAVKSNICTQSNIYQYTVIINVIRIISFPHLGLQFFS